MKYTPHYSTFLALAVAAMIPRTTATVGQASLLIPSSAFKECGTSISDSDFYAAISPNLFAGGPRCGETITVQVGGKSVNVKVEDECPICIDSSIELTQAAYTALDAPVIRPVTVNWNFD
ncbi:hypothetical protein FB451DRAFT_1409845 [Mycena latifolia]|nr:hypothetical protein FB451DRAFT_1409845 [Mycena latifolia]